MAEVVSQRVERSSARARPDQMGLDDDIRPISRTPEDALDESAAALAEKDAQIARERTAREAADAAAAKANANAVSAQEREINLQGIAIDNAISAAEGREAAATAAWRTAREANDIDAEQKAVREMTLAAAEVGNTKARKQAFEQWKTSRPKPTAQPQPKQGGGDDFTPQVKTWLTKHPAYFRPGEYRENALAAHDLAILNLGREKEGSQEYVDYIDKHLEQVFGKGHGQITKPAERRDDDVVHDDNRSSSRAAPPSRDGGDDFGGPRGDFVYNHAGGQLRLTQRPNKETGQMVDAVMGTVPEQWKEAAKWARMPLVDYVISQMNIQREIKEGGNAAGLTQNRNGVYE